MKQEWFSYMEDYVPFFWGNIYKTCSPVQSLPKQLLRYGSIKTPNVPGNKFLSAGFPSISVNHWRTDEVFFQWFKFDTSLILSTTFSRICLLTLPSSFSLFLGTLDKFYTLYELYGFDEFNTLDEWVKWLTIALDCIITTFSIIITLYKT